MNASVERRPRILCVDDEQHLLDALVRILRNDYDITTALGGTKALETLMHDGPYAAVMSDMTMPGIDGVTFLMQAAAIAPDTVRILLTGQADLQSAIDAFNRAGLFRFLVKPTSRADLTNALDGAIAQHGMQVAERELLEQTLRGAVDALLDALALANPIAFARANRIRRTVVSLLPSVVAPDGWSTEVAASLAQVGAVALPASVAVKLDRGARLDPDEQTQVERIPSITEELLGSIPRLGPVREAIRLQTKNFDGSGLPKDRVAGEQIPIAARLLKVATDLDELQSMGFERARAVTAMEERHGLYDPDIIRALVSLVELEALTTGPRVRELRPQDLAVGMTLARDVIDANGVLLIGRGFAVTRSLIARLANVADRITDPIWITQEGDPSAPRPPSNETQ